MLLDSLENELEIANFFPGARSAHASEIIAPTPRDCEEFLTRAARRESAILFRVHIYLFRLH